MRRPRTGGAGLGWKAAASCPSPAFRRMKRCQMGRARRFGSRSTRRGRWPSSPVSGLAGPRSARSSEGQTTNDLFAFLTCKPNKLVGAIHPKAMPVILTTRQEVDLWMTAPPQAALTLQRPLPEDALTIVARGERQDDGGLAA